MTGDKTSRKIKIAFLTKDLDNAIKIVDDHIFSELKSFDDLTIHNYNFPYSLQENKIKYSLVIILLLIRAVPKLIVINYKFDIIHYSSETSYLWIFNPLLKMIFNKKTVITIHHLNKIDKSSLGGKIFNYILSSFDLYLPISNFSKNQLLSLGIKQEKITIVRNGIDKDYYPEIIPGFKNYKYILFVGDEYPRKNLTLALTVFSKVIKEIPGLKFIKIGKVSSSDHKLMTDEAIKDLGIKDGVVFMRKFVSLSELRKYYSNAEMLISSSLIEGFGLPVMEACRCRCIPLVSNIETYKEFDLPEELYVKGYQDVDLWVKKISTVYRFSDDKKGGLKDVVYKTSLHYSWIKSSRELRSLYHKLMSV